MIPAPLVIAGVVVAAAIARRVVSRVSMSRRAATEGWLLQERDDDVARTFTLPPFVDLPAPGWSAGSPAQHRVQVRDIARFTVRGSKALACSVETFSSDSAEGVTYQVVALHTRQHLPRTMIRAGIDVYSLPAYEGMVRLRERVPALRRGTMAIVTADAARAADLPFHALANDLGIDHQLTVVADGDWLYAYRGGAQQAWRVEPTLLTLQRFARAVDDPPWPRSDDQTPYVYGQIT